MNFRVHAFGDEMEVFIPAPGMHMVYNALAAISVGYLMGVKPAKMQQALAMFRNAGMRQEIIKRDGYTVIADCYNAGPESMEAALQVLADTPTQGRRIAVLGDMLELGVCSPAEHYRIGRLAAQTANALFTYGKMAGRYISGAVTGGMNQKRVTTYKTHEELADALKRFAKPGDVLFYTKPLGIGIVTTAAKVDLVEPEAEQLALTMMQTLNKAARDVMVRYRVHACTDITGFGMLGHTYEMAQGSDVQITLQVDRITFLPQALDLARMGILPAGLYRNRSFAEAGVDVGQTELAKQDVLFDPQTAGGLLISVAAEDADAMETALQKAVPACQRIGTVAPYTGGKRILLR